MLKKICSKLAMITACLLVSSTLLTGCGSQDGASTATATSEATSVVEAKADETAEKKADTKKKIVVIQEDAVAYRIAAKDNCLKTLSDAGFKAENGTELTVIELGGDEKKSPDAVAKIKELKPDVVVIFGLFSQKTIAKELLHTNIPIVVYTGIENAALGLIDEKGMPKDNVIGIYTMPADLQLNAFKLLQKISPANGKKAVFTTAAGSVFKKEAVESALKSIGVELKAFNEVNSIEELIKLNEQYNKDDEVAWHLKGNWPIKKADGSAIPILQSGAKDVESNQKPDITFYEIAIQTGMLGGLGVDIPEQGTQAAELAIKILNGEKVQNIKAVYPRKTNIILNKMRADKLKINFPPEILGSASKVFLDYKGTIQK